MTKITREVFVCCICGKEFEKESDSTKCEIGHDIVYIGMERSLWKQIPRILEQAYLLGVDFDPQIYKVMKNIKESVRK